MISGGPFQPLRFCDSVNNKKGFYRYTGRKQAEESVPPLISEDRELASSDVGKAEVLNKSFALLLAAGQAPPHGCQDPEALSVGERSRFRPSVTAEQVQSFSWN